MARALCASGLPQGMGFWFACTVVVLSYASADEWSPVTTVFAFSGLRGGSQVTSSPFRVTGQRGDITLANSL